MSAMIDRAVPPHNDEAEMCALGAMVLSQKGAEQVRAIVKAEDFYQPSHRVVFEACCELVDAGKALDLVTLPSRLAQKGSLEKIGGVETLIQILDSPPSGHNAGHYAQIVLDLAILRRIGRHASEAMRTVFDESLDVADKVCAVQESAAALRTGERFDFSPGDLLARAKERPRFAIPTGFAEIDSNTQKGGLCGGQYHLFGAMTGKGKTWLACQFARLSATLGNRVCFVSLEMDGRDVVNRMVQQDCGYADREHAARFDDCDRWDEAAARLDGLDLRIVDGAMFADGLTVESLTAWLWAEHQVRPWKHVIVDYVQLLETSRGHHEEWRAMKHIASRVRLFAIRSGIRVDLFAQVDKDERGAFQVRGTRELHKWAASYIVLDRPGPDDKERPDRLLVIKNRFGRDRLRIEVELVDRHFTFAAVAPHDPFADDDSVWRGSKD